MNRLLQICCACMLSAASMTSGESALASDLGGPAATGEFPVRPAARQPGTMWETRAGFRDWGRLGYVNGIVLAGHINDNGGLRAIDALTGRIRWHAANGEHVWATPVSDGKVIVVSAATSRRIEGYSLSGKRLWAIKKELAHAAEPTIADGVVYLQEGNGNFSAVDVATGQERWHYTFGHGGDCATRPVVADGVAYFAGGEGGRYDPWAHYFLYAVDVKTGHERWRYQVKRSRGSSIGYCLRRPLLVGDTLYVTGGFQMLAIDRATGSERWVTEAEANINGKQGFDQVNSLIYAGGMLYGMTPRYLAAFDPDNGRATWHLPGRFSDASPTLVAAGGVLYFQGAPEGMAAKNERGTLFALDLASKQVLWSYTYPRMPDWSFDDILPVDGGVVVNTYGAVVRLQSP